MPTPRVHYVPRIGGDAITVTSSGDATFPARRMSDEMLFDWIASMQVSLAPMKGGR